MDGVISPALNWISYSTLTTYLNPTFTIFSSNTVDAGTHSVVVTVPISNGTYTDTITTSITLDIIDPCLTTTFNACAQTDFATSVLVSPALAPQSIS